MNPDLLEQLRALLREAGTPADATVAPRGGPPRQVMPVMRERMAGVPQSPAAQRGVFGAILRSAEPSPDTPMGWANEMFNPIRQGAVAREMAGRAVDAAQQGQLGKMAGMAALTAMAVPGVPGSFVERIPIGQLGRYREFLRKPSMELVKDISQSGIREPLLLEYSVADHALRLTEGNNRLAAAEALGMPDVPVSVIRREGSFPRRSEANPPVPLSGPRPATRLPEQFALSTILPQNEFIDVDGVLRPRLNSAGRPIHPTEEGIRNFWRNFGDTKIVDESGRPRVVVHGTRGDFDTFVPGGDNPSASGRAIFSTSRSADASEPTMVPAYHNIGGNVAGTGEFKEGANFMPLYANVKNPLVVNAENWDQMTNMYNRGEGFPLRYSDNLIDRLRAEGYDGVWNQKPFMNFNDEVVAFDPAQMKSATGNRGTFDTANDNMLKSIAVMLGLGAASRQQDRQPRNTP